jgi:hypothetical protein
MAQTKKIIDYPEKVLETYDVIEKLLVGGQDCPIVSSNSVKSDVLLYVLNELYQETNPEPEIVNSK